MGELMLVLIVILIVNLVSRHKKKKSDCDSCRYRDHDDR